MMAVNAPDHIHRMLRLEHISIRNPVRELHAREVTI